MTNIKPNETDIEDWNEWWVNPVANGSTEPDPADLAGTKAYIEQNYSPEIQAQIQIKVRSEIEE
ncbi:hypothetical protein [Nostoc sp. PA-18-2419]|uniref:hypothetical protein n=1 Tax=Nostoc sp. PA-18-2419 TaxID=2575443 RepID=UPI001108F842|nr:hypothetical protein [Nostoc sp. PA-18-2419]